MRTPIAAWITLMVFVTAPLAAQDRAGETKALQSFAAALAPGTFVEVRMKNGSRFTGTLLQRLDDRVMVKPRTRVAVPAREVLFADLESISVAKQGMSPGMKVLVGTGVGVGVMTLIGFLALVAASGY